MDVKGIAWAGNIYKKFEAMCLEVEEVVVQDTVNYIENKVQKASVSVQKFYSEVVQDLLHSSCVKVDADDSSVYHYSHTDIDKKLKVKPSLTENSGDTKNNLTESKLIDDMHTWKKSPVYTAQNAWPEVYLAKGNKVGAYKRRPVGIKGISEQNNLPKSKILVNKNTLSDARRSTDLASIERCDYGEIANTGTLDAVRQQGEDTQCISSSHELPAESVGIYSCNAGQNPQLDSNVNSHTCNNVESGGEEVISSDEDIPDMAVVESGKLVEPGVDIIEPSELEETCVLIEGNELHSAPQGKCKHKSYKKKFCEAFSSKSRSRKKQEYDIEKTKLPASDLSESDWEFL